MGENQKPLAMENGHLQGTDLELVKSAQRGDHAAFHELVDRYASQLYRLAFSLVDNAADAEDVVQEAFLGAFRGLRSFEHRSSVKTWLVRILVRQAAGHFRRTKRHRGRMVRLEETLAPQLVAPAGAKPGVRMDINAAIRSLSPERREVIVLRELQGMSYEEIAQVLGIPRGTVESRLFRARRDLQQRLGEYLT